jgi:dethiobiotin synthetase
LGLTDLVAKILFVTGTDTGVGKTLVTASLLHHLRTGGTRALAIKPFCSGMQSDVRLLQSIQRAEISDQEANPFYFRLPLAPLIAARKVGRKISIDQVIERINRLEAKCDRLLVEGAGGLLSPLGWKFNAADLIARLRCDVCVVAANKLGVLNHVLLTVRALPSTKEGRIRVVLTQPHRVADLAAVSNLRFLQESLAPIGVSILPYLGSRASSLAAIQRNHGKVKRILESVLR